MPNIKGLNAGTLVTPAVTDYLATQNPTTTKTAPTTIASVVAEAIKALSTVTPAATDEVVIIDDPSGTPSAAVATVADIVAEAVKALSVEGSPLTTDQVLILDDPAGTPTIKLAAISNIPKDFDATSISSLPVLASPALTDEIVVQDDPGGTPIASRATIESILDLGQGAIGSISHAVGTTDVTAVDTTYVKINNTAWDASISVGDIVADHANGQIVVATAGTYLVGATCGFGGTANKTFTFVVHVDGVAQPQLAVVRKLGAGGDVGAANLDGAIVLTAGQVVDLRVKSDSIGNSVSLEAGNLTVHYGSKAPA